MWNAYIYIYIYIYISEGVQREHCFVAKLMDL